MKKAIGVVLFLLAAMVIALFLDRNVFIVRQVEIEAEGVIDKTGVIRASGVELGARMRDVSLERIARDVESSGQYACVLVEKELPSTVRIALRPRVPAVIAEAGGFVLLMDDAGYVMSITGNVPDAGAVYVTGLDIGDYSLGRRISADESRIHAMGVVVDALDRCAARELASELNVADLNGLYLYSRTGIHVSLGDARDMNAKILLMKYVLMDLESRGETSGRLDVSSGEKADFDGG
ncbi:MAG: cell division protein FtsQ/DivIB [Christensenellales bacterium]|jgi:cell division protein FtsQ